MRTVDEHDIKYLEIILNGLSKFYSRDYELIEFNEGVHEQTFTTRLAHYLERELDQIEDGCLIDCEYSRDIYAEDRKKSIYRCSTKRREHIRPDIIYHDRGYNNQFCIEAKWNSMQQDNKKVLGMIREYRYYEGYCVYNIHKTCVSINLFINGFEKKGIKCRFRYSRKEEKWLSCEITCFEDCNCESLLEQVKAISEKFCEIVLVNNK